MPANMDGISVLIVDDDQDILTTVRLGFESCGAEVATANDGHRGLEKARRLQPDLLILDMMMPKKSGFLVMEQLKPKSGMGEKPHVIMITANEGKRHEAYAKHLGVADYLSKPFAMERLIESAAAVLGRDYRDPETRN